MTKGCLARWSGRVALARSLEGRKQEGISSLRAEQSDQPARRQPISFPTLYTTYEANDGQKACTGKRAYVRAPGR
jgi:hypothetical protein